MSKLNSSRLGRWGEDLVAKYLGFKRQPFSGGAWPYREDLIRLKLRAFAPGHLKELAQVKTTASDSKFLEQWLQLAKNAAVEKAEPVWYDVIKTDWEAYVFERRLVRVVKLGVGGEEV